MSWDQSDIALLESGEIKVLGQLTTASNASLYCEISDGAKTITAVYKPIAGERPLWDFPTGTLAHRERPQAARQYVLRQEPEEPAQEPQAGVVEAGTFTKAADSLGLPKAAVTRLIQSLEDQLQVRLLNRTTRRVTVTPDGAAYYERVYHKPERQTDLVVAGRSRHAQVALADMRTL